MATLLRRPPEFLWSESLYKPDQDLLEQAGQRWESFCRAHPEAFDGGVTHVTRVQRSGCGGATLHLQPCPYRFHVVQDEGFDLGVRLLGVTAIVVQEGRVLMGQRSEHVAHYKGMWEFGPSGVVESQRGVEESLAAELHEEVGLKMLGAPIAKAILFDRQLQTWELVYQAQVEQGVPCASGEYTAVRWVDIASALPQPLSPLAAQLAETITVFR